MQATTVEAGKVGNLSPQVTKTESCFTKPPEKGSRIIGKATINGKHRFPSQAQTGIHTVTQALAQSELTVSRKTDIGSTNRDTWRDPTEGYLGCGREYAGRVFFSALFAAFMNLAIILNLALVVYTTDTEARCFPEFESELSACPSSADNVDWAVSANRVLLGIYTVEAAGKIYASRLVYFRSFGNLFDFAICILGWLGEALASFVKISWMRVFRLWRVLKLINTMSHIQEIRMLVAGLGGAVRAMFYGSMMLGFALFVCSILMVQFVHPIAISMSWGDCERCHRSFRSVMDSMLTLFQQIVAGDSWGLISIPVMEKSLVAGILFPLVQLLIAMCIMNLILAVVVDKAMEHRESSREAAVQEKVAQTCERKKRLLQVISEFDVDMSGTLSRPEILDACQSSEEIRMVLAAAGIQQDELGIVLGALESERDDAEISYVRFCNLIHDIEAADMRKLAVVNGLQQSMKINEHSQALLRIETMLMSLAGANSPSAELQNGEQESVHFCSEAQAILAESFPTSPSTEATGRGREDDAPRQFDYEKARVEEAENFAKGIFETLRQTHTIEDRRSQLLRDLSSMTCQMGRLLHSGQRQQTVLLQSVKGLHVGGVCAATQRSPSDQPPPGGESCSSLSAQDSAARSLLQAQQPPWQPAVRYRPDGQAVMICSPDVETL